MVQDMIRVPQQPKLQKSFAVLETPVLLLEKSNTAGRVLHSSVC